MVKIKNTLSDPVKVIKLNAYSITIQPGNTVDVTIDPETVGLDIELAS